MDKNIKMSKNSPWTDTNMTIESNVTYWNLQNVDRAHS